MNSLPIFRLEEFFTQHEFSAPYLLSSSDAESFSMQELLDLASKEEKEMWESLSLGYTETKGLPLLRKEIQKQFYPSLKEEHIICFAGAEEGIFAALFSLCEEGDHVIVLTPCYQSLLEVPKLKGSLVTEIPLKEASSWKIDLEKIKKAVTKNTRGIILNFPHNPTGQVLSPKELQDISSFCSEHKLWLFSDEVYRLLGTPELGWSSPACEAYDNAYSLGVMSKSFGLSGLRIGWIASQNKRSLSKIKNIKDYLSICNSAPSEILALIALRNVKKLLERNNKIVRSNLALLEEFFSSYSSLFSWIPSQGGCVGFVRYHGKESVQDFCKSLLQSKGVLLLPSEIYAVEEPFFRIGFGRKNFPEALNQLKDFLS